MDFVLALGGLAASFPITLIVSSLIYLEDRGPVFYCQSRVGKDGKLFKAYKFRTMIVDSDKLFGPLQAKENDPRITRIGRLLRFTALDELPQLYSILKGDMSFVGPRALLPAEKETGDGSGDEIIAVEDIAGYENRILVKPGLTGVAQIFAPRDINRKNKFRYDRLYVNNMSLLFDIKLIAISFCITFKGSWEKRESKI
ncbi:MAG: sugar transferase [Candidatus Dadabacteria bacterium]|nr:sugar transferase [Candidatus Dadabacteria bacterium]NIS07995.1 sugar transferase [Candidatus Dadabacteria bacterium]NIV41912.1 sugar transferase [Candidatus Dadabacteria bacterium]NIX16364.1 sugar transferase [Candidatus Dadabacteria bacterium]NIY22963.1 sugar transferase [Candidatus Dadabacteria bacterium]